MSREKLLYSATCSLSECTLDRVNVLSKNSQMPLSRVLGCLIDNALENNLPHVYDIEIPEYDEDKVLPYTDEGAKIYAFLKKMHKGIGIDVLMTLRDDIGVTKEGILLIISDLIEKRLAIKVKPSRSFFNYPEDYRLIRLVGVKKAVAEKKSMKQKAEDYDKFLKLHPELIEEL